MKYSEAKDLCGRYNISEWDFKTTAGFIFAVEFFHEEWLREQEKEKFKQSMNYHTFDRDRVCSICGMRNDNEHQAWRMIKCHEVLRIKERGITIEDIESYAERTR